MEKRDLCWSIALLVMLICVGISYFATNQNGIVDFLSSISSAISIVLSVVAIFFTMISGHNSGILTSEANNQIRKIEDKINLLDSKIDFKRQKERDLQTKMTGLMEKLQTVSHSNLDDAKEEHHAQTTDSIGDLIDWLSENMYDDK